MAFLLRFLPITSLVVLWNSLVESSDPETLFMYGVMSGMCISALSVFAYFLTVGMIGRTRQHKQHMQMQYEKTQPIEADEEEDDESEEDEDDESDEEEDNSSEPCKMALVIRTDLDMSKGKVASQCCHATLAAYQTSVAKSNQTRQWLNRWERFGQTKVTLKCPDKETMLELQKQARQLGLVARSICDAGRTQIAPGSRTVLAIGPAPKSMVDKVTGLLKLY